MSIEIQAQGPGHMRGGHGGTAIRSICPAGQGAVDVHPGCGDIHRGGTVIGKGCQHPVLIHRRN